MNLIYIADPMCSWCYGFGKTVDALLAEPGDAAPLQLALLMGGLRPYTKEPLAPGRADEIFGHWRHVHEATGLPFAQAPNTSLHEPGFVYDTEPASRAVVTLRALSAKHVWRYFKAVQQSQAWGIRGFPALVAEHAGGLHLVAQGHLPLDGLRERLATLLATPA